MHQRIAKALAAGTFLTLPLLTACGASTAPAVSSAAPAPAAGPSTSAAVASPTPTPTPTPSATPVDETKQVQAASRAFVTAAFAFDAREDYADYRDRIKPLMTDQGYASFEAAHLEKAIEIFRTRYGRQSRTLAKFRGSPKVDELTTTSAQVTVAYANRAEQRRDGKWRTVRSGADDSVTLPLVKQDGRWLVDDLS